MNLIALAIPLFFGAIATEFLIARKRGVTVYRSKATVADLSCGIGSQVFGILVEAGLAVLYHFFYENFRFFSLDSASAFTWVFAYTYIDFAYYWWHRASHRVNFLWGVHIVHHQSQDYNLAVALRQAWLSGITSWPFYLPLAFLGVATPIYVANKALNTLYQFWIHTELFKKRAWLDKWLNTPSAHRVHHAINPEYLDKNYASTFQIWDRAFGTYQEELAPCVYGTVKPYTSWNSLWCNVDYFMHMGAVMRQCRTLPGKLSVIFLPPDRVPSELNQKIEIPQVDRTKFVKFDTQVTPEQTRRIFMEMGLVVIATTWLLFVEKTLSVSLILVCSLAIVLFLGSWGMTFDNHRHSKKMDIFKWLFMVGALAFALMSTIAPSV